MRSGVNFLNVLQAALARPDPHSTIKTVKLSVFYALFVFVRAKAAHKTLVKLTPDCKEQKRKYLQQTSNVSH